MAKFTPETIVEALLFASVEPLPAGKLARTAEITEEQVHQAVSALNQQYEQEARAFRILEISCGYQFRTLPELSEYLRGLGRHLAAGRLSPASLETLAIIAYRQPITRAAIEKIRGVDPSGVLRSLLEKKLITVSGRAQALGRPLLYGTTPEFLRHFGLADLSHLPKESELEVLLSAGAPELPAAGEAENGAGEDEEQPVLM